MSRTLQNTRVIELGIANANNNYRDLSLAVAALAQEAARRRLSKAVSDGDPGDVTYEAVNAALTDNSGGTGSATFVLAAGVFPALTTANGVLLMAPKAGFDTAVAAILAAHAEIQDKINALFTTLGAPKDCDGATTATDGTIAAIAVALTGVADTTCVAGASGRTQLNILRNNTATLAAAANYCRVAVGLHAITDNSGGNVGMDDDLFELADTAATAAAVTTGAQSLLETEVEAYLTVLRNSVATLADAVDQVSALTPTAIGPFVIATANAGYKFYAADTTV